MRHRHVIGKRRLSTVLLIAAFAAALIGTIGVVALGEKEGEEALIEAKRSPKPGPVGTPEPLGWTKQGSGIGEETLPTAEAVTQCPLDAAGCAAVESLLALIDAGDASGVAAVTGLNAPGGYPIGGQPALQIRDATDLASALAVAKTKETVAVGCPPEGTGGLQPTVCARLFVLALDINQSGSGPLHRRALAFVFIREAGSFRILRADIEEGLGVTAGGTGSGIALPLELTGNLRGLWYTPWKR